MTEHANVGAATCPMCHTTDRTLTNEALTAGGEWHCSMCGQSWTALRLATVAAYATWAAGHDRPRVASR